MSLLNTLISLIRDSDSPQVRHLQQHTNKFEDWEQLNILKQILCMRSPYPALTTDLISDIDQLLIHSKNQRILTHGASIPAIARLQRSGRPDVQIKLWQGDITSLASDVTAITNAANSQMLGCFQPSHKCIDNVIHSMAGPRLRQECYEVMQQRGTGLPVGEAVVTKGYCLAPRYIVHTVGPQLHNGAAPTDEEKDQLRQSYASILDSIEGLPVNPDGLKRLALCCISTGLFAFPTATAAQIANHTVLAWITHHDDTTITEVIFVTFAEGDYDIYKSLLVQLPPPWTTKRLSLVAEPQVECSTLATAQNWLTSASNIIISAGAGLSAADGLDYTSKALFRKHFPAFLSLGLTTLYSAIGFTSWPGEADKWSYYFHNVKMVSEWDTWPTYQVLIRWLEKSGKNVHIRTSNADGVFLANGWDEIRLSTPQGRYSVLQCLKKCRVDATYDMQEYYQAALPYLDPQTQKLTDETKIPKCKYCGGEMMICVRGGEWFIEAPFAEGEKRWREFRREILREKGDTVILELGVGMNTPGVLRWPDEDLVRKGKGRARLVRVGVGPSVMVPRDLEEEGIAVCVEGDIKVAVPALLDDRLGL